MGFSLGLGLGLSFKSGPVLPREGLLSYIKEIDGSLVDSIGKSVVTAPAGFTYPSTLPRVDYVQDKEGSYYHVIDIEPLKPTGQTYYVSTTGDSSNDGLTWETALDSIRRALQKVDCVVVYVEAGTYERSDSWQGTVPLQDVSVIAVGGTAVSTVRDYLSWTADGTYPNVSRVSRSAVDNVYDSNELDSDGDAVKMVELSSVAEVSMTPGSWYTDGATVWCLPYDERLGTSNDETIWVFLATLNGEVEDQNVYIEGIEFHGGLTGGLYAINNTATRTKVVTKGCKFKYCSSSAAGGLRIEGNIDSVSISSESSKNGRDGFNYHDDSGYLPAAIEVECIGHSNGDGTSTTDNGSTMHDGGTIVRYGGEYYNNIGPNVIDVNNSSSWCINTLAKDSLSASTKYDFYSDGDMWLDACLVEGTSTPTPFGTAGVLYWANMDDPEPVGAGSDIEYTRTSLSYLPDIVSGSGWSDWILSYPDVLELQFADDGTFYTAGVPNSIGATERALMSGDQFWFSANRGLAYYDSVQVEPNLSKIDRYFGL